MYSSIVNSLYAFISEEASCVVAHCGAVTLICKIWKTRQLNRYSFYYSKRAMRTFLHSLIDSVARAIQSAGLKAEKVKFKRFVLNHLQ